MQRTITPTDLQSLFDQGASITLLDVRRADDRAKEPTAIPCADWRDPAVFEDWSGELDRDQDIILYCVHGGSVSNSIVDTLLAKGLKARFIEGGLEAWKAASRRMQRRRSHPI